MGKIDIVSDIERSTAAIPNHFDLLQRIDTNARRSIWCDPHG
jgi:hypothetical protein